MITVSNCIDAYITIPKTNYITKVNSWAISMDAIKICNCFNIDSEEYWLSAMTTSIAFKNALYGTTTNHKTNHKKEREMLFKFNIGIAPEYNNDVRKQVAYLKWIISTNIENGTIDAELVYFIGFIAGICLYVNELDLLSNNKTNNYYKLTQPYTINEV